MGQVAALFDIHIKVARSRQRRGSRNAIGERMVTTAANEPGPANPELSTCGDAPTQALKSSEASPPSEGGPSALELNSAVSMERSLLDEPIDMEAWAVTRPPQPSHAAGQIRLLKLTGWAEVVMSEYSDPADLFGPFMLEGTVEIMYSGFNSDTAKRKMFAYPKEDEASAD
jgi:hypothetical protein